MEFQEKCSLDAVNISTMLSEIKISEAGVRKILLDLDPHKAPGPDGINPRVLKQLANEVAPILTMI